MLPASHSVVTPVARRQLIGMDTHVVRVDQHVGVDVDQPGKHVVPLGAHRAHGVRRRKRRRHGRDLAADDADVHHAAQSRPRIEHFAACNHQIELHGLLVLP